MFDLLSLRLPSHPILAERGRPIRGGDDDFRDTEPCVLWVDSEAPVDEPAIWQAPLPATMPGC